MNKNSTSLPEIHIMYRVTSPIRNIATLGPYSRTVPRALWWSWWGGLFLSARYPCTVHAEAVQNVGGEQKQHLAAGDSHHAQLSSISGSSRDPETLETILNTKGVRISDTMRSWVPHVI